MSRQKLSNFFNSILQFPFLSYFLKWLAIAIIIGILAGSASAFFLFSLGIATNYREQNLWVIALLPAGGLLVGLCYHYFGTSVVKGNNQLIEEIYNPQQVIPFRMAPLVLFGTLVTHLFGGSAGREGTALQMGGAIADQFSRFFKLEKHERKIIIIMGISAGFASVFGTPLTGAVFALEVIILSRKNYSAIIPSFLVALIADYACKSWHITHVHYSIDEVPALSFQNILWSSLAGVVFGLVAMLFSYSVHFFTDIFKSRISYAPFRPLIGGVIIALSIFLIGHTDYIGLGIPIIQKAFTEQLNFYDFLIKILFTAFTLGAGFKGGEVTPLFYIGATLGNALAWIIPLPIGLLAGMGFVAIFSGATNAPVACTLMGMELLGLESGIYIALACTIAYLFSGNKGIYTAQGKSNTKQSIYALLNKSIAKLKY
jgi:H+/Cl- antiporter ClcA